MILSTVRRGVFEDSKSDHGIGEEETEVCLDREMHEKILEAQGFVDNNTDTKGPGHGQRLLGMHWRIQGRLRQILDAIWTGDCLHFEETEKA